MGCYLIEMFKLKIGHCSNPVLCSVEQKFQIFLKFEIPKWNKKFNYYYYLLDFLYFSLCHLCIILLFYFLPFLNQFFFGRRIRFQPHNACLSPLHTNFNFAQTGSVQWIMDLKTAGAAEAGFMSVTVNEKALSFSFHNESGGTLYVTPPIRARNLKR